MRGRTLVTLLVIAALLAIPGAVVMLLVSGGSKPKATVLVRRANVDLLTVRREMMPDLMVLPVVAESPEDGYVKLSAEVAGRVVSFPKREGESIARDEVVTTINREGLEALQKEAEASVATAEASVKTAQATVKTAEATLAEVTKRYDRVVVLFKGRHRSKQDVEGVQAELDRARAELERTRAGLEREKAGVTRARAAVVVATVALRNGEVRSPIAGRLDRRYVDRGEYVSPGQRLADVVNIDRLYVIAHVPEADRQYLSPGMTVQVTFKRVTGENGVPFVDPKAVVRSVSEVGDAVTRTYRAQIAFDNTSHKIKPGMIGTVAILRRALPGVVCVPKDVVISNENEKLVYVVSDGRAVARRLVLMVVTDGKRVVVEKGLQAGERVIRDPRYLRAGEPVRVRSIDGKKVEDASADATDAGEVGRDEDQ